MVQISQNLTTNRTQVNGAPRSIFWLVIHDMEAPEKGDTAEAIANYFKTPGLQASAHYNIDVNSVVQSVLDKDVAWAAPNANATGLHFEHAGYASQSAAGWADAYSTTMLRDISAPLVAAKGKEHGIPLRYVGQAGLRSGTKGIVTHHDVTMALNGGRGHTDPGANFPMTQYVEWVQAAGGIVTPPPEKPISNSTGALQLGSSGSRVKALQSGLNRVFPSYSRLATDGQFGPATAAVVRQFQRRAGLTVDGIVGPNTTKALTGFGVKF